MLDAFDAFDALLNEPKPDISADAVFISWHEWQMQMIDRAHSQGKAAYRRRMAEEQRQESEKTMAHPVSKKERPFEAKAGLDFGD